MSYFYEVISVQLMHFSITVYICLIYYDSLKPLQILIICYYTELFYLYQTKNKLISPTHSPPSHKISHKM